MNDNTKRPGLTRRRALAAMTATGVAAIPFSAQAQPEAMRRLLPGANICVLTPQQEEGPFYFNPKLERVDITEKRAGVPLGLRLQIVAADDCTSIKGARVDVWHADALGYYSGYPGQSDAHNISTEGGHFLRGTQFSDGAGLVKFTTIYPGWYHGRTAHIHMKVFLDDKTVLISQLYFPDALSEYLYKNVAPYNTRARERDTVNATDHVVRTSDSGHMSFCSIKEEPERYLASLIVGVDRHATISAPRGPEAPPSGGVPPAAASGTARQLVPGIVKAR